MKHIRLYIAAVTLLFGLGGAALAPQLVMADSPTSAACSALGSSADCSSQPSNGVAINSVITAVINVLSMVVGVVAVIMIIVGGFKYVTSNGDSSAISSARSTITYAIVGLIIVALAQVIVRFVLAKATGN